MINVYLDLDGVMVDLDSRIRGIFGRQYKHVSPDILWRELGTIPHLYRDLKPMPDYKTLFSFLNNLHTSGKIKLEILTSLPYSTHLLITCRDDKIDWVRSYLSPDIKVNTVVGGVKKAQFVEHPTDILIDDTPKNIDAWNTAGGVGILFKNNADVIARVSKQLEN